LTHPAKPPYLIIKAFTSLILAKRTIVAALIKVLGDLVLYYLQPLPAFLSLYGNSFKGGTPYLAAYSKAFDGQPPLHPYYKHSTNSYGE
jgi:hypothetical protein